MKQIKLLGILAIALTLGLASCNKGGNGGDQSQAAGDSTVEKCKTHDWGDWVTTKEKTCTEDGEQKRTCKVCGEEQTKKINKGHDYGDWVIDKQATCEEVGSKHRTCKACQNVDTQEIPLADHTWGEWEIVTAAKCEEDGERKHVCDVCGEEASETITRLGHEYEKDQDGNDIVTWSVHASCTVDGVGTKPCIREGCDHIEQVTETKWGHKMVTTDTAEPEPGKAAVRVYHCTNPGCDQTYFGFKATETGANSGRLVEETDEETGEVGKRFWGRPIGNDVELDENGSASQDSHEAVYNPETQGDLFEYNFDLTQAQIDELGPNVVCYADAKPAAYLGGQDFWAADLSKDEYTPGYYIEGDKAGTIISDYRYILYVDDHPVEFDSRMEAPVPGSGANTTRAEFLMPYIFHFTAGTHKISLRMAGGYRSVFYNFTFRPYDVPADIVATPSSIEIRQGEEAQITCAEPGVKYASSSNSICTVDDTGKVTAVGVGKATITISKEGNYFKTKIPVTVNEKLGVVKFEAETDYTVDPADAITLGVHGDGEGQNLIKTFAKDAVYTKKFNQTELAGKYNITMTGYGEIDDLSAVMSMTMNGQPVTVNAVEFKHSAGQSGSADNAAKVVIAQADLILGENTMTIKALGDVMPEIDSFRFDPVPVVPEHVHAWTDGDKVAKTETVSAYQNGTCECNAKRVLIDVASDLNGKIASRGAKLGATGDKAKYVFPVPAEAVGKEAELYFKATVDNAGNYNYSYYYGKNGGKSAVLLPDGGTNTEVKFNGEKVVLPESTYSELGMTGTNEAGAATFLVNTVTLAASNELTLERLDSFGVQYYEIFVVYK